ncbi:MAG TPA: class I SAM-dependent methyltransferase [Anaerolineae bacterium]
MDEYLKSNRQLWDDWTGIHERSKFYDVEGFKAGQVRLDSIERELGDVGGKSLLHLQCHFGLATLSWARLGAQVTGADFSERAIALARRLSGETGIPAQFVCSNLYDLPASLPGEFDFVFTSHGVLGWLPDLDKWGQVIAHFLKPGGLFYIVEAHPLPFIFDDAPDSKDLHIAYSYFESGPMKFDVKGSYADLTFPYRGTEYSWNHSLSEIFGALLSSGLHLESFREYPYMSWQMFPFMEQDAEGWWRLPDRFPPLPLMFSLKARK